MTNPALSVSTTNQIGRLYQKPGGGYPKHITSKQARQGLENGTLYPSITNALNVLNKNLEGYYLFKMGEAIREGQTVAEATKAGDRYRDLSAYRGTMVHQLIEEYINHIQKLPREASRKAFLDTFLHLPSAYEVKGLNALGYARAFTKFARESGAEFIQQETTVYGSTVGGQINYAGTTDFIAKINGEYVVGDWKCTSKLRETVASQLAAVRNASHFYNTNANQLEEWNGHKITKAIAVRLQSDGTYEAQQADIDGGWETFKHLRALWDGYALGSSLLTPLTF